jgi:hypothetical protein
MELVIANVIMLAYILHASYHAFFYSCSMTESASHHLLSHAYIVGFFMMAFNLFIHSDFVVPLVFSLGQIVYHFIKEDSRLLQTNRWTHDVEND